MAIIPSFGSDFQDHCHQVMSRSEGNTHHGANIACQSKGCEVAIVLSILVEVSNVDLDACVVLCCDELIGPRAA